MADLAPLLPLVCILGGDITRASLQQVQRDIDMLCSVSSTPATAASRSPAVPHAQAHSLRRVLEVCRSAQGSGVALRDSLIDALGVSAGSSAYRELVLAPRHRMQRLTRGLAAAVRDRCLAPLVHRGLLLCGEPVDVHVQLYPSRAASRSAVPAELLTAQAFIAAVTVRRLSALEEEAAAAQELRRRYMDVAAKGQTLSSALGFWADVSYGDAPPAALADFPPLGFAETEASARRAAEVAQSSHRGAATEEEGEGAAGVRQLGRKSRRTTTGNNSDDDDEAPSPPVLVLGVEETDGGEGRGADVPPRWLQPPSLLSPHCTAPRVSVAPADAAEDRRPPALSLRYADVGLLAVVYVHMSGTAYVVYSQGAGLRSRDDAPAPAVVTPTAPPASPPPSSPSLPLGLPTCALPMSSSSGFVRSLLGLM
ncbi:hypothetical protein NESM_000479800 [Novymonas esmeraldas]|uniref:Uncharacterized protein n=1 Tax=Novymonas esmeraldas TaxID=1808958 RepID=A0AAW0EN17_9TRYP